MDHSPSPSSSSSPSIYLDVMVEAREGRVEVLHGHQHVLHHVMLLVQPPDGLPLGELQQGDLGRNHPAEQPAEDGVVAEGNDVLETHVRTHTQEIEWHSGRYAARIDQSLVRIHYAPLDIYTVLPVGIRNGPNI